MSSGATISSASVQQPQPTSRRAWSAASQSAQPPDSSTAAARHRASHRRAVASAPMWSAIRQRSAYTGRRLCPVDPSRRSRSSRAAPVRASPMREVPQSAATAVR
ncbi:hypothetical protein ACN28C_29440 [Plantactinospora sp. WMMC1484]|uniref:hypothetical protein n=1 Tax=Plantactinospora sp. WMMC1484 TaxID=3404122 RepID=UPI003BF57819